MYSNQQQQYGTPQGGQYPGQYPSSGYPDSPPQYNPEAGFGDQFEGFSSKAVRLGFIRKVYGILSVQLAITFGFVFAISGSDKAQEWTRQNSWLMFVALAVVLVTMITLACCGDMARKTPHNYICLFLFTLAQSFLVGVTASLYQFQIVIYAVLITGVICLGLTLFAFQTKIDFTIFNGMMFIIFIVFVMFGFIMMFFPRSNTMHLIYSCIGAFLFSAFLLIDTQMILGGSHKMQFSAEDYVFAALTLYLDIINIFMYMLQILQAVSSD
ncbi:glutamate NMDA receptor-associated protein 1 lifeguard isoform X2 [Dermatophagoides farinae]|uniref:glutamate NMDA receptor-associated protein 1 lifeguard isoform X2 n=1 Tax=Dermatophagoides farinae TaxID=6954 RepID=UPI001F0ECBD4|nr:protein lifeguard 1-like isoform X2 [Dermatophagoides farinae]